MKIISQVFFHATIGERNRLDSNRKFGFSHNTVRCFAPLFPLQPCSLKWFVSKGRFEIFPYAAFTLRHFLKQGWLFVVGAGY
jgi:hypothetical protein